MQLIAEIDYFRKYLNNNAEHSNYTDIQGEGKH